MTAMQSISSADAEAFTPFSIPESNEALGEALTRLAGHINAAHYRFLKLLAALIEREAWSCGSGIKSPAHWLNYYCGIAVEGMMRMAGTLQAARPFQSETWVDAIPAGCC